MVKEYHPAKLEKPVYQNLIRLQALRKLQTGERVTISQLIQEMIDQQPSYEVTAKKVNPR